MSNPFDKFDNPFDRFDGEEGRQRKVAEKKAKAARTSAGAGTAFQQGMMLDFFDELSGAKNALIQLPVNIASRLTGQPVSKTVRQAYDEAAADIRALDREYSQAHPVANVLLRTAGGVASPVGLAGGGYATGGATLAANVGRSALVGGAYGAVAGAGAANGGLQERAIGAGKGAAVGATVGAAIPLAAAGARTAARSVNAATGYRFGGGPAGAAASRLRDALRADGVDEATIDAAVQRYAETGAAPPTLADVAGENTRALLRTAGSRPGEARNVMQTYRDEVREGLPDVSITRARQLTPDQRPAAVVQEGIESARGEAARVQYREPYAQQVEIGDALTGPNGEPSGIRAALQGDAGRAAIQRARRAAEARQDYTQVAELDALLNNEAETVSAGTLDRIRIAMGERGRTAVRQGARDIGGGLNQRAAQIDEGLAQVEGLAPAREAYRNSTRAMEAVDSGLRVLKATPDEFAAEFANAPPQAIEAARVGARQAITDALGQRPNAMGTLDQIAFAPNTRRNLEALFGQDEAERFIQAARLNLERARNANFMAPNTGSQTQPRQQDQNIIASAYNVVRRPIQAVLDRIASGLTITDQEAAELVRAGLMPPHEAMRHVARQPNALLIGGGRLGGAASVALPATAGGMAGQ